MSDPICRVQNPYPNNVVKLVHNLPHSEMSNDDFKEYMKNCEYGYDRFFKTYYQLACQLGLYYIDAENNYHPRFLNDINEEQAKIYLINWFSKYYVPNPYTRGFELLKNPILVEDTLYEYIKKYGNSKQILEICQEIFKEEIGNPDIFINAINSYSRKIKISNNKFEIKDFKEGSMETGNNRDDKKAFFDTFSKDNGTDKLPFPHNRIIFGAPGTGKSHSLELDRKNNFADDCFERVTFHPNYSYAQFVGTYKPVQDSADENQIKYEYIPGPFMRIYTAAKQNPSQIFLLLIEEINRANVAAVFGDVFQLLDRDENGNSEYPVAVSEDIKKYLAKNGIHEDDLKIPSNMYIWATMNSADQGVFPMDTAFKRRWEFEYIGIDENEDKVKGYEIPISATKKVNWNDLRKTINNKLITLGINEDKLLGPFFLSKTVLDSAFDKGMDFVKLFESKVLMYLFEDAAKMKAKQLFNVDEKKFIYSEVCKKFEAEGLKVFRFNEEDVVEEHDIAIKKDDAPSDGQLF